MRFKLLLYVLLPVICESSLFAQQKYDFYQFRDETWSFIKQPTKWQGSDLLIFGVAGAGAFMVLQFGDQPVRDAVLRDHRYDKTVPIEGGRVWGELYAPVVLFTGYALHSIITGDIATRKIAFEVGQASLYAGGITYLLKLAIGRARPYTNEGTKSFYPFGAVVLKSDYQSFPGGHTTAGMVLSTVLSRNADSHLLKVLAYVPVAFTFVSRIYQDKHWTSDDFAGAVLGYYVATWVVDHHEQEENRIKVSSIFPFTISVALN